MNQNHFERLSPLFLLGIARSGTTLLQSLLDGHPQLLVDVADSQYPRWYKHYHRWLNVLTSWPDTLEKRIDKAESVLINHIFNEPSHYYQDFLSDISIAELQATFRGLVRASAATPKDFKESYFHALGLASKTLTGRTLYWVDKTLSYEYLFYRYHQWWPNARFIHVVRDPRDVYTSYKKRDIKNNRKITSIDSFALVWHDSVRATMDCQRLIDPGKRCILRYEDLVHNPEAAIHSIADFLGIDYLPDLLKPTKGFGKVPWGGNAESGKKQNGIYHGAANKWRGGLSAEEVKQLESLLHHEMEFIGYPLFQPARRYIALSTKLWGRKKAFQLLNLSL